MTAGATSALSVVSQHDVPLCDDLLHGVDEIAAFIFGQVTRETKRKTYYLASNGYIPIGKEGAGITASKSALRAHYARLTAGAERSAAPNVGAAA
jgi:hypothetical protein